MLNEPTTLAASASALAEAVTTYGCDARELFQRAGLDMDEIRRPGARYPFHQMIRLWHAAVAETGDPCIGLSMARALKPQALHALGLSWLASRTIRDGLARLVRYERIANTSLKLTVDEEDRLVRLDLSLRDTSLEPASASVDATLAFVVRLCRLITNEHFAPTLVTFRHGDNGHLQHYVDYFQAPVLFGKERNSLYFDAVTVDEPVPAGNEELAAQTDRIADQYLATLDPSRVQDRVREILLTLLPSGEATQEAVSRTLHRSTSALQRQLKAEGSTYRKILDRTRQDMALELVREHRYSLGQIAYLLGFSDQASFSRAFKRWTGSPPTEYR